MSLTKNNKYLLNILLIKYDYNDKNNLKQFYNHHKLLKLIILKYQNINWNRQIFDYTTNLVIKSLDIKLWHVHPNCGIFILENTTFQFMNTVILLILIMYN